MQGNQAFVFSLGIKGRGRCGDINQVKRAAQVHHKRIFTLADKDLARRAAAGDVDAVNVLRRVRRIIGQRFVADIVDGLGEGTAAVGRIGDGGGSAAAAIARHQRQRKALLHIQRGRFGRVDGAGIGQRHRHILAPHRHRQILQVIAEAELEGQMLMRIADVVDVDFIQRIGVHQIEIRATRAVLQRLVVGDQGNESGTAGFVATEHIKNHWHRL